MTERKGRVARKSDRPSAEVAEELKEKRDAFLHTFFKRGAELTEELVGENRRLLDQLSSLEQENAALRTQLASDNAIRDLLTKIDQLEREKSRLLSTVSNQAEISNRFAEVELELESFANLYVATFQLHSSLRVRSVVRHIRELLVQLVGVRSLAIYFADDAGTSLLAVAAEGLDVATLPVVEARDGTAPNAAEAIIERTYLTGIAHVAETEPVSSPAACIPLRFEDRTIGVVIVYALLEHKKRFVTVDRELFKLIGAHAGGAIVSAYLWGQANGRMPTAAALRDLCA